MTTEKQQLIAKKVSDFLLTLRREEGVITNLRTNLNNASSIQLDILIEEEYTDESRQTYLDTHYTELSKRYGFTQNIVGMIFEHHDPKIRCLNRDFRQNSDKYNLFIENMPKSEIIPQIINYFQLIEPDRIKPMIRYHNLN